MSPHTSFVPRPATILMLSLACVALGATGTRAQPPIVQPGAPGEPSRLISAADAKESAGAREDAVSLLDEAAEETESIPQQIMKAEIERLSVR